MLSFGKGNFEINLKKLLNVFLIKGFDSFLRIYIVFCNNKEMF